MNIGIDIDGVLTDEHNYIIDKGTKFFGDKGIKYTLHKEIYDSEKVFEVTKEQWREFWNEHIFDYSKNILIRPFASEIIKKLKNENNKIFIITARYFTTYQNEYKEQMQNIVKQWLEKNNVLYDEIIFSEDKVNVCKKLNINLMIEDKPENILSISSEIPVICYNHPYNENLHNKNIIRCYCWHDIYEKISKLNKGE